MEPLQEAIRKYLSMSGVKQFDIIKKMGLLPDSMKFVSNHERDKEFFSRIKVGNEQDKFIELMGILPSPAEGVDEVAETEDVNLLKRRLEFYRNETAKIRDYVFDDANKCGFPTQSIFEAITDKIDALKAEIANGQSRQGGGGKTLEYKKELILDCDWNRAIIECIALVNIHSKNGSHSWDHRLIQEPTRSEIVAQLKYKLRK